MYPAATPDCIDFLNNTIAFNPNKRIKITDCLEHSIFKNIRNKNLEKVSDVPIVLDFENEEELTIERLRELFI